MITKLFKSAISQPSFRKQIARQLHSQEKRAFSILLDPKDSFTYLHERKVVILHTSTLEDNKKQIFGVERIPGARFFDLDVVTSTNIDIPRMLPALPEFRDHMHQLGINADDEVLAYDDVGVVGAARILWMLNTYGNDNVKILDGGFPKYKNLTKPVEVGEETWVDHYHRGGEGFEINKSRITHIGEVRDFLTGKLNDYELVDARPENVFKGETPDGGHIPNSKNLFYQQLLEEDGTFKKPSEMERLFRSNGINLSKKIICTSYSGMTASVLYAALRILGKDDVSVYDGAWLEWSKFPENEIASRAADTHHSETPTQLQHQNEH